MERYVVDITDDALADAKVVPLYYCYNHFDMKVLSLG